MSLATPSPESLFTPPGRERQVLRDLTAAAFYADTWLRHTDALNAAIAALGWRIDWRGPQLVDQDGQVVPDPWEDV